MLRIVGRAETRQTGLASAISVSTVLAHYGFPSTSARHRHMPNLPKRFRRERL
jgi:hypothetical protein